MNALLETPITETSGYSTEGTIRNRPNKLSVVICTLNRCHMLAKVLNNLVNQEIDPSFDIEIIIVDNNSTDATHEVVQRFKNTSKCTIQYIFEKKAGKSYALNHGLKRAQGDIIAFTDDDVVIPRTWLKEINTFFLEHPECSGIGGKVLPIWPEIIPEWIFLKDKPIRSFGPIVIHNYGDKVIRYTEDICPPIGSNMAFRKYIFEKYNSFDTKVGKSSSSNGGEDTELCLRLRRNGEKLYFVPQIVIFHPVEKERLTKHYFRTWFYNSGRVTVRLETIPNGTLCILYVPAYMIKKILKILIRMLISLFANKKDVFKSITSLSYNWGQICEFFSINMPRLKWKIISRVYSQ